uniref:ATP synthase complex subunit 8 n=1 Tax=Chrysochroa fulgidissima TaxID=543396 RepID=C5H680_9COLE|nr:ATP synthase F0 subunit 8 [Chrysochroa fulgidissima]ACF04022.1 ATP synthase F0 subunit 8 [Chrysochroa fulgidissima]
MPQMAPMLWTSLFIAFSITLIIFSLINFFSASPTPKILKTKEMKNSINWKW